MGANKVEVKPGQLTFDSYDRKPKSVQAKLMSEDFTIIQDFIYDQSGRAGDYIGLAPDGNLWAISKDKFETYYIGS